MDKKGHQEDEVDCHFSWYQVVAASSSKSTVEVGRARCEAASSDLGLACHEVAGSRMGGVEIRMGLRTDSEALPDRRLDTVGKSD